jgi:hypothetical protein
LNEAHQAAIREMCRVALEVRFFPPLALGATLSPIVEQVGCCDQRDAALATGMTDGKDRATSAWTSGSPARGARSNKSSARGELRISVCKGWPPIRPARPPPGAPTAISVGLNG